MVNKEYIKIITLPPFKVSKPKIYVGAWSPPKLLNICIVRCNKRTVEGGFRICKIQDIFPVGAISSRHCCRSLHIFNLKELLTPSASQKNMNLVKIFFSCANDRGSLIHIIFNGQFRSSL